MVRALAHSSRHLHSEPERLERHLRRFARVSETSPGEGVTRLAYTRLEQQAHDVFAQHMRNFGLQVWADSVGNSIAEYAGSAGSRSRIIGTGSHLDSVPRAGRFDGVAGVAAAMEVAQLLAEQDVPLDHRVRFIAFRAEEGARFGQACNGSGFASGTLTADAARQLVDSEGTSLAAAMKNCGFDIDRAAEAAWDPAEWRAFIELHVEQGQVLEAAGRRIGVVSSISGSARFIVRMHGEATHSGGTPMELRRDALVAAARCITALHDIACEAGNEGVRITVGRIVASPGSMTTIAGDVEFSVDVRDFESTRMRDVAERVQAQVRTIAEQSRVDCEIVPAGMVEPVALSFDLARFTADAATTLKHEPMVLTSGASHDSAAISRVVSTGMIFVPSKGGLSHVPAEETSIEDLAAGTDVLLETILRVDGDPWP